MSARAGDLREQNVAVHLEARTGGTRSYAIDVGRARADAQSRPVARKG